jgi:hypothetical protein
MAKWKTYPIDGLLKHAQVCRILCKNRASPRQFYIMARICHEHLPTSTLQSLRHELGTKSDATTATVHYLRKKGLVTVSGKRDGCKVSPTLEGWAWFFLILAEMERPIRENTVYDAPKKTKFGPVKHGKKAGRAMKKLRIVKLATKRGLSIWERSALASLPAYQRLDVGALESLEPVTTAKARNERLPSSTMP